MLRAPFERGTLADTLVGASAGALNAADVASRPQTVQTAEEFARCRASYSAKGHLPTHLSTLLEVLTRSRDDLGLTALCGD